MKGFVCEEQDFELNALSNREPMEIIKHRCNMFIFPGECDESSCRILQSLQFI